MTGPRPSARNNPIFLPMTIPPELEPHLPQALAALAGLLCGWLLTALVARARRNRLEEQLKAEIRHAADLEARLARREGEREEAERETGQARTRIAELQTRLEAERQAGREKQSLLELAEDRFTDTFRALSAEALRNSSEQFFQLARQSFRAQQEQAGGELDQRRTAIEQLVTPMRESLGRFEARIGELEKAREGAYAELRGQVRSMAEAQAGLQRETGQLVKALRQPTGRGQWGEIQLRRVVEMAGMQEHCDFHTQSSTTTDEGRRLRPDLVVRLPGGRSVVVDAKTPMDAYLDALEAPDEATRGDALARHARQVRQHVLQLSSKNYTAQFDAAPEFTVLFLPSESFFSAALQADPTLIEKGVEQSVILATPTTLIALLRAVSYGWRQQALNDNAREIWALGRTMHERLRVLGTHLAKLGRSLDASVESYNRAVGSYESRVLGTARKLEELEVVPETQTLDELPPIEKSPRPPIDPTDESPAEPVPTQDEEEIRGRASSAASDLRTALGGG